MSGNAVKIEKLVFGGHGLGRDEHGVILISGAATGEVIEYESDGLRGGVRVGHINRIVERSPHRRTPPCDYAGICGGCDWLHLSYPEQIRCKKEIFLDCIDRIGKFPRQNDIEIFTAAEFGYRMRAQIKIDRENKTAGFYRKESNDVVKVNKCPLLVAGINDILTKLNSGMINAVPDSVKAIKLLAGSNIASYPRIGGLTDAATEINVADVKFLADGGSFFQSNKFLLETLGRWAARVWSAGDRAQKAAGGISANNKYCLDLYGGIGFFSLMLADCFNEIVLVENVAAQVEAANQNFRANKKNHLKALLADVERGGALDKLVKKARPDCVIVDPPRPGLVKNTRAWLTNAAPPIILYISCNPSTFARDARALIHGGYTLSDWALFDLYPNTHHIESAAIFRHITAP